MTKSIIDKLYTLFVIIMVMKKSDDNVMNKNVISLFWLLNGGLYKDDITRNTSESTKIVTRLKVSGILKNVSECKYIL